jgi:hypothetical protein
MKKFAFLFLTLPFFLLSCGDDDEPTTEYKNVTVEIEHSSEFLSALGEQCLFTLDSEPVYNKLDWDMAFQSPDTDEYQFVLTKTISNVANKTIFSFKQKKVNFLLQCFYGLKDENADEEGISIETKVTVKVDGKIVNTETVLDLPLNKAIRYSE